MDTESMNTLVLILTVLSYLGTFMLGYGMRSYIYSHQRRYE
jgi:hypothetical protein